MRKTKICPNCTTEFMPQSSRQKYCNRDVLRTCVICGAEFNSTCSKSFSKCCSKSCTNKYAHQQSVASYQSVSKQCILCGKDFTPRNNTQVVCDNPHFRECSICSKSFTLQYKRGTNIDDLPKTCSKECATKLKFKYGNPFSNTESRVKAQSTMQERYGVSHPMQSQIIRDKVDATMQERYGVRRYTQTEEYKDKAKATNQTKYATDWAIQSKEVQEKAKATLVSNYGVESPMQSDIIKQRVVDSYHANTGYNYPAQNPDVQEKTKRTNLARYGVEYALQNKSIRTKQNSTMVERYGVASAMQVSEFKCKAQSTNLAKYGYINPAQSPDVQTKISDTMLGRYGVHRYAELWEYRKDLMIDSSKLEDWQLFTTNPESYIMTKFDHKPTYSELSECLGVTTSSIQAFLSRHDKLDLVKYTLSSVENAIVDILLQINPDLRIERHNRKLISPYELDIYLPDYDLALEINPTSTHNSTFGAYGSQPKSPIYHKQKSVKCESKGVFLFHIFGYEWTHKREVIISMLRNLIGCNIHKLYARKCDIREVPAKEAYTFLSHNHRQGGVHSAIRYGLYYDGELVSLMTFGKMRNTLGIGKEDLSDCWELVRFCNKLDTSVVGAASKLFKHFVRAHTPSRVRSFSDRAHTKGNLYATLGFNQINVSRPGYVWVNLDTDIAYNRVHAQKHNIKKFLGDDLVDLTKSERQIMEEHGFVQVYDSGTITWEWKSP